MTHTLTRRSVYALLLIGAMVGCSAPPPQPPPAPSADVSANDGGVAGSTSLGSIGRQGSTEASAPGAAQPSDTTAAATTSGANGASASTAATPGSSPAEAAARARVQAAREEAKKSQAQATQQTAEQCQDLASQIRAAQATERAAPSTSIDRDIVDATLAKADKRIDRLQQQYDSLGCPNSELPSTHQRVPQLPPAPGALPP